jgi:hypothetical protein
MGKKGGWVYPKKSRVKKRPPKKKKKKSLGREKIFFKNFSQP